ncbi:hypothetical protein [Cupriavidus basilensis]|uniref:hypothetical protein n=1 Tax=Cupriavidus basilensis TaxID=68895 RepID=UPI003D339CA7
MSIGFIVWIAPLSDKSPLAGSGRSGGDGEGTGCAFGRVQPSSDRVPQCTREKMAADTGNNPSFRLNPFGYRRAAVFRRDDNAPLLAAAGAKVMVRDASDGQLEQDRRVACRDGLP